MPLGRSLGRNPRVVKNLMRHSCNISAILRAAPDGVFGYGAAAGRFTVAPLVLTNAGAASTYNVRLTRKCAGHFHPERRRNRPSDYLHTGGQRSRNFHGRSGDRDHSARRARATPMAGLWIANTPKNTEAVGLTYQMKNWDLRIFNKRVCPMCNDNGTINQAISIDSV